eukprot:CAMPEP_0170196268 /NCGR_PEP_ID=MMETSP0040_2-20121228/63475_1 /TAXON_ID=641309 /ORGANISM="Lotharella oceanica, Strain CCMP622" /LENGTH=296 /DNA_ID=CAMNT_0010445637 /DNA_START=29 /DNA_END=919 /DNA_ORIENTATION=-
MNVMQRPQQPQTFRRQFKVFSVACAQNFKANMEEGDKILLPQSAFHELGRCMITYPMMFQVKNPKNDAKTHCGVMEFTAPEGVAYFPFWMMSGLCLQNGDIVDIKSVTLAKGNYVKFQPHKTKFTTLSNPRVVLEKALRAFSCLTKGGTIAIKHGPQQFYLDIIETRPGSAITIIDTDVNVDFAPPKDYKETKAKPATSTERKVKKAKEDDGDVGTVWGASSKAGSRPGSSYFKKLSGGNTLSGRKPKRATGLLRASSSSKGKALGGGGGWGAQSTKKKPFSSKGYSLKSSSGGNS